jgi:hypothetical protein
MGLYEYGILSLPERLQLVWHRGTFLANVKTSQQGHNLYALYNFFVEVELTYKETQTVITDAVPFVTGERLNKYLGTIDLTEWIDNR